jgi:hypothetical protein
MQHRDYPTEQFLPRDLLTRLSEAWNTTEYREPSRKVHNVGAAAATSCRLRLSDSAEQGQDMSTNTQSKPFPQQ